MSRAQTTTPGGFERLVQHLRANRVVRLSARVGLVARAALYLLLGYLAAATAAGQGGGGTGARESNGNGALTAVAATPLGLVTLGAAALSFTAYGLTRITAAVGDHSTGRLRRLTTAGHGAFYLALTFLTARFVIGQRATGSEAQQQRTVDDVFSLPAGRLVVGVLGAIALGICAWQVFIAAHGGFADSLDTEPIPPRLRPVVLAVSRVGIVARALAVAPLGIFALIAAWQARPGQARGMDQLLTDLTRSTVGRGVVWLVAVGFLVFGAYSLIEARYRQVHAGG